MLCEHCARVQSLRKRPEWPEAGEDQPTVVQYRAIQSRCRTVMQQTEQTLFFFIKEGN